MEKRYKYIVDVLAFTQGFEQRMQGASTDAKKFAGEMEKAGTSNTGFASKLGSVTRQLGTLAVAVGGPIGALTLLATSIKAVEGPGDRFEEVVGGGKEALFELQRAIGTMDFSNFLDNLKNGYTRGKEFTAMLDELADRTAYNDYIVAGLKVQSAELRETIRNKTLELKVRQDAGEARNKIEEKVRDRAIQIAEKAFIIERQQWEERNKMGADEAIKLYETIDTLNINTQERLAKAFTNYRQLFGKAKGIELVMSGEKGRGMLQGISDDTIQSYGRYLALLDKGEKDVLIKLFDTYKKIDTVRAESQMAYTLSVRETTMLLVQEEQAIANILQRINGMSSLPGLKNISLGAGNLGSTIPNELRGTNNPFNQWQDNQAMKETENSMQTQIQLVHDLAGSFSEVFRSTDEGFKSMARSMLTTVKNLVAKIAGYAAVFGILKLFLPGSDLLVGGFKGFLKGIGIGIPGLASGGLAYGPTVARIGEYPGASVNPEVISPLSELKKIINVNQAAMPSGVRLAVDAGGNMLAYIDFQQRKLNNFR